LDPDRLITPNDKFFVRTAFPAVIDITKPWALRLGGGASSRSLTVDSLKPLVRACGVCLLECAGNTNPSNFGLLSAAEWAGVPLGDLLDRLPPRRRAARVLVSGVDDFTRPSHTSVAGASWIFTRDEIEHAGAF